VSSGADDGTVLFVGDLSRSVKEDELTALFAPYGALTAVDIKRDKLTQHNLGYAFVALASRAEATRAKLALHGFELHGRKLRIGWAQKNTTLFIGDLDGACTTQQLIRAFEPFGHIIHEETFVKQPSGKYVRHTPTSTSHLSFCSSSSFVHVVCCPLLVSVRCCCALRDSCGSRRARTRSAPRMK
jgi:RNA recognition motif-containing protein